MSNLIRICDVREKLMECWKRDAQSFRNLRNTLQMILPKPS